MFLYFDRWSNEVLKTSLNMVPYSSNIKDSKFLLCLFMCSSAVLVLLCEVCSLSLRMSRATSSSKHSLWHPSHVYLCVSILVLHSFLQQLLKLIVHLHVVMTYVHVLHGRICCTRVKVGPELTHPKPLYLFQVLFLCVLCVCVCVCVCVCNVLS